MSTASPKRKTLPLGIDHLGALSSYLRTLMGAGTLANELIQNADDAKSEWIAFRIGPKALIIDNAKTFSDCNQQEVTPCPWEKRCDFHGFRDIASQGKRQCEDTTGAFGIGFTAVLQVTDAPELISAGRHWTINHAANESKRVVICDGCEQCTAPDVPGTRFVLPWANNKSIIREKLGVSPLPHDAWIKMADELKGHLPTTILFLRTVERIDLMCGGEERLVVTRGHNSNNLELTIGNEVQRWLLLSGQFVDKAEALRAKFPVIEKKREACISLAIPRESAVEGLLYACLPTEHDTGLPFHIHGAFFPTTDRKRVVFGDDYQSLWNRQIIACAAATLVNGVLEIRDTLGPEALWQLVRRVYSASCQGTKQTMEVGQCFWQELCAELPTAPLIWVHAEHWARPEQVRTIPATFAKRDDVADLLRDIGIDTVHHCLIQTQSFLESSVVGVRKLNVGVIASALLEMGLDQTIQDAEVAKPFDAASSRKALCELLDTLLRDLPVLTTRDAHLQIENLRKCSLARCGDGIRRPLGKTFTSDPHTQELFWTVNRGLTFLDDDELPSSLQSLCNPFTIDDAITAIESGTKSSELGRATCCELINWFKDHKVSLQQSGEALQRFRGLSIFPTATGFRTLNEVVLPGKFTDPLAITDVLDESVELESKHFLEELGVKALSLEDYIDSYLPHIFATNLVSAEECSQLVRMLGEELGRYRANQDIREVLRELPIIATESGTLVSAASDIYFGTKVVRDTLGPTAIIVELEESQSAIVTLYEWLGVRKYPALEHVVVRIANIVSENPPEDKHVDTLVRLFEHLGEQCDVKEDGQLPLELIPLKDLAWFPCERSDRWFFPGKVSSVFNRHLFSTTGDFLAFSYDLQKKHRSFLRALGVTTQPTPEQVLSHLRQAAEKRVEIDSRVYTWLEKKLAAADLAASDVASLRNVPCLYVQFDNVFIYPRHCYIGNHPFGQRRCLLSGEFSKFPNLLNALGVKNVPDADDAMAILHEIEGMNREQHSPLSRDDATVINGCWRIIESSLERDEIQKAVEALKDSRVVCRPDRTLAAPKEVFFNDCIDLSRVFQGQLDRDVINRGQGTWRAMERAGVRQLSKCVEVKLVDVEEVGGDPRQLQLLILERRALLARVLDHFNGGSALEIDRLEHLTCYEIYSGTVAYSFTGFGKPLFPVKELVDAHYRVTETGPQLLYRTDNYGDMPWDDIARELSKGFEDVANVGEIAAHFVAVLSKRHYEQAERSLDKFRIAALSVETIEKLEPATVASMGAGHIHEEVGDDEEWQDSKHDSGEESEPARGVKEGASTQAEYTGEARRFQSKQPSKQASGPPTKPILGIDYGTGHWSQGERSPRSPEGTQTRRAVTYVGHSLENSTERTKDAETHRNSIDQLAIDAVLKAERESERDASFQGAFNQGYDIRSDSENADEPSRLIEVKGLSGEWSAWGVKLSPSQHEAAKRYGDRFWLYVVEYAGDATRQFIWRIQNPSEYVNEYRLDGGWKQLSWEARQDDRVPLVGEYIERTESGAIEEIVEVEQRGTICRLTLKVAADERAKVVFNRTTMRIIRRGDVS